MKILGRIVAAILVGLVSVLIVLRITGLDPKVREKRNSGMERPGLWLTGKVSDAKVADWSFTDDIPTVMVQTHTWYGLPHSLITACNTYNGSLYLISVYPFTGGPQRVWNRNVFRDPHVRIKVGETLYDVTLFEVIDPTERAGALASRIEKYGPKHPTYSHPPRIIDPNSIVHIFRIMQ